MKKLAKRITGLLLTVALAASFSACGSEATQSSTAESKADTSAGGASAGETSLDGKTITFTMQKYGQDPAVQDTVLKGFVQEFKEKTGITVKYSIVDWSQALTKLTLACTGGEAPDVADVFFTTSMVKMGKGQYGPMDVTDIYNEMGGNDAFYAIPAEDVTIDGKVYGIPWRMDTRALIYNKKDFEDAGITEIPKTYDELIETAKKLTVTDDKGNITHSGVIGNIGQTRFDQVWFSLLAGHGGSMWNKDYTELSINSTAGEESLAFLTDLSGKYKVSTPSVLDPSYDAISEFMAGKVSMILGCGADAKTSIVAQAPQMKDVIGSAVMPNKTGEGICSVSSGAPICIMKSTKELEASKEWLKFFCSTENQVKICSSLNYLSANKKVMADPIYANDEWFNPYIEESDGRTIQLDPPVATWSEMDAFPNGPINQMCTNVVSGKDIKTELTACDDACKEIQANYVAK